MWDLTRRQRNDIFDALKQGGVEPAACEMSTALMSSAQHARKRFVVRHRPSGSRLTIRPREGSERLRVTSGVRDGPDMESNEATWDQVLSHIVQWAEEVAYVTETPDFWDGVPLPQVPDIMAATDPFVGSNAPFTPDEQEEIARRLDEVGQLVLDQFDLTSEELVAISRRLDHAEEASKRLGRKDWLMLFYGAMVSTAMTDGVPPSVIQTVLTTVLHGIAHIFGFGGPPPIISS